MERRQELLERAFLLHARPYGDTSSLLEMFSREHGRIGLMGRGARAPRARRRGLLQPFQELVISWVGRGELPTLTDVESRGPTGVLTGTGLISGFYLNELLMRLLRRDDPHPELYDDYAGTLGALRAGAPEILVLRIFEKRLLEQLGYGLLLEHDAAGQPIEPDLHYRYRSEEGPQVVAPGALEAVPGRALLALSQESAGIADYPVEIRNLLREALAPHLGDRPLKSRELLRPHGPGRAPE